MVHPPSPALLEAAAYLSSSPSLAKVSSTTKLEVEQLYGLYKFLTVASAPQTPRPSLFDLTGRAKWDAWTSVGKAYKDRPQDAEKRYLDVARELKWAPGSQMVNDPQGGEVWDEDLGVSVSMSPTKSRGGMGGSVSVMVASEDSIDVTEGLHAFAIQGDMNEITRVLKEDPLAVNRRDEYGYTALHLACDRGGLPVVKVLLKHGADATLKDPDGLSAMELAHIAGHDEICAFLQTHLH